MRGEFESVINTVLLETARICAEMREIARRNTESPSKVPCLRAQLYARPVHLIKIALVVDQNPF